MKIRQISKHPWQWEFFHSRRIIAYALYKNGVLLIRAPDALGKTIFTVEMANENIALARAENEIRDRILGRGHRIKNCGGRLPKEGE